MPKKVFTITS